MTEYAPILQPAGPQDAEVSEDLREAFAVAAGVCAAAGFAPGSAAVGFVAGGLEAIAWVWNTVIPDSWKAEGVIAWPVYADPALRETERLYNVGMQAVEAAWADLHRRGKLPQDKQRASAYLASAARARGWEKYAYHAPGGGYVIGSGSMYAERYLRIYGDYPATVMQISSFGWPKVPSETSQADVASFAQTAQELINKVRIQPLLEAMDETLSWIAQQAAEYRRAAYQYGWRWCAECQGLFFAGASRGACPAGGSHNLRGSANYGLANTQSGAAGQPDWRWCRKCQGLFFAGAGQGACPAGGAHDPSASGNYALLDNVADADGQPDWRWCRKCQGLFFAGAGQGVCPAGGAHDPSASGNYTLLNDPGAAPWIDISIQWRSALDKHLTHLVSFCIAERACLVTYDKASGAATFARFRQTSGHKISGLEVLATATWAPGWTHIEPFFQNGANHLILYNKQTGKVRFERIKDDGTGVVTVKDGSWAAGWSEVRALRNHDGAYLVVYNKQTGKVRFDRIKDDGTGSINVKEGAWATGWDALIPLSIGPSIPHLLVYDRGTGRTRIDHFNGASSVNVYDGVMLAGWSHLEHSGNSTIGYNAAAGYAEIYRPRVVSHMQSGYVDFELIGYDIVFNAEWAAGWSCIMPLRVPYRSGDFIEYADGLMFYNAEDGTIHVDSIDG